jgi:hypothetical protein
MWFIYGITAFVLIVYLCVRARFWVRQPVRLWWSLPKKNKIDGLPPTKYLDHANVRSYSNESATADETTALVEYLQTQTNDVYYPNAKYILAYFVGAFISVYGEYQGSIVSRPLDIRVDQKRYRGFFHETMTSDQTDVSRRLLSTHGFNLAQKYPEAPSVFSTTYPLLFVLPALQYEVCWVQTVFFQKHRIPGVTFLKITDANVHLAIEWWNAHPFGFQMVPTIAQTVSWLQSKTASIYFVVHHGEKVGCFYFKKTLMLERNEEVIDCCGATFPFPDKREFMFNVFSTLMHRFRRVNSILRLHLVSNLTLLPYVPYFKKTNLNYYFYRYTGFAKGKPSECFVF